MTDEESRTRMNRSYRRLNMNPLEQMLVAVMLLTLVFAGLDAMDGQHIGKSNAVTIAKLQGQQELMASTLK